MCSSSSNADTTRLRSAVLSSFLLSLLAHLLMPLPVLLLTIRRAVVCRLAPGTLFQGFTALSRGSPAFETSGLWLHDVDFGGRGRGAVRWRRARAGRESAHVVFADR